MTRADALKKLLNCCGFETASAGDPEVAGLCRASQEILASTPPSEARTALLEALCDAEKGFIKGRKSLASTTSAEMQKAILAFADTLDK